jgi:hypothetical protein
VPSAPGCALQRSALLIIFCIIILLIIEIIIAIPLIKIKFGKIPVTILRISGYQP